ncbi:1-acyl-sn-glycerol-3-phosphate acyltransferase epsilon-like [Dermacentor andersoni]|uniref:1-acyl-sn-glycerol-3-phosphate acyltransferase epsilon-like n=1 Tax=Dermacentor andersoni TaxID=34620 RepID=UPI002417C81C|nr:1-acyl-sn-glycerol-3-phosphate acyltransferase epsilon-like [Dermacentor andersoni]
MRSICDVVKLSFHIIVLVTMAAPLFLLWTAWRLLTGLAALPPHVYQVGDDMVFHFCQRLTIMLVEGVVGIKVLFHGDIGDIVQRKERAFYIVNHQSSFDWIAVSLLAERTGCTGNLRYIVKQTVQSLPLLGFYFHQHGCIYINRQHINHFKMKQGLYYLQNKQIPSNVVLFPEGNRFIPGKMDVIKKSTEFAISQGLPVPRHQLMPRTQGFVITVEEMRGNLDAVYCVTLIYGGTKMPHGGRRAAPGICDVFTGRCGALHMHIKRTPIDKLPEDDSGLKKFIFNAFYEKDALLTAYYESDDTPPELQNPVLVPCEHVRGKLMSVAAVFTVSCLLLTPGGRACVWKTWLYGSIFGYSWLGMNSVA